jgi:hypothetical protein
MIRVSHKLMALLFAAGLAAGCDDKNPSPTAPTPTATASPTTAAPPAAPPAAAPAPAPAPAPVTPSSVRVECSSFVARTEKVTCRAIAVTPSLQAAGGRIGPLLDSDVSDRATWSSSNPSVATVTRGEVEGLATGSASIEAAFQGVTGRTNVEVKKNEMDLIGAVAGRYRANGTLINNTCSGTNPLMTYTGEIDIASIGVRTRDVQLSYDGRVQRTFRTNFTASAATGELRFESEPLAAPFGSGSPVQSTKLTATANASGQITSVQEQMSCGSGGIVFRIDVSKFF